MSAKDGAFRWSGVVLATVVGSVVVINRARQHTVDRPPAGLSPAWSSVPVATREVVGHAVETTAIQDATAPRESAVAADPHDPLTDHLQAVERHKRDGVDPNWAPTTQRAFETDLAKIGDSAHFDVIAVDCRTTSCIATLQFENYASARHSYGAVLTGRYTVNCAKEITLETPTNDAARYQAVAVFDCSESRAQ